MKRVDVNAKISHYLSKYTRENELELNESIVSGSSRPSQIKFEPPQHSTFSEKCKEENEDRKRDSVLDFQTKTIEDESDFKKITSTPHPNSKRSSTFDSSTKHFSTFDPSAKRSPSFNPSSKHSSTLNPSTKHSALNFDTQTTDSNLGENAGNDLYQQDKLGEADRSTSSLRSGSSMDCLVNGKLPIESNRVEMVWGCVKIGKSSYQDFTVRNKSHKKLRMQMVISGGAYKFAMSEAQQVTSVVVLMHPLETKSFCVSFSPVHLGACVEKIKFLPVGEVPQTRRQHMK